MPQPTAGDVHVDAVLTNISVAFIQDQKMYVATKVFPVIPVDKQSNKYYSFDKNDWFRDEAKPRADATESAGSGYGLSTDTYFCDPYAIHKDVGNQARKNADPGVNLDESATRFVTGRMLLRQEIQWVTDYFALGIWGTDVEGGAGNDFTQWNDYADSDPLDDFEGGKEQVLSTTGYEANTLVLGYQVWRKLKRHPDLVDLIKYTGRDSITPELLAKILEIDNVYVAKAVKATNAEGVAAAYDFTHGKNALLCYANPNPGLLEPSAGYIFAWTALSEGLGEAIGVSQFYLNKEKADRFEAEAGWDNKVVASDMGYFYSGAVA